MEAGRVLDLMLMFTNANVKDKEITITLKSGQKFKGKVLGVSIFNQVGPHAFMRGVFVGVEHIGSDILVVDFQDVIDDDHQDLTVM